LNIHFFQVFIKGIYSKSNMEFQRIKNQERTDLYTCITSYVNHLDSNFIFSSTLAASGVWLLALA